MIVPDKFTQFNESILGNIEIVLKELDKPLAVLDLFRKVKKRIIELDKFVLILDALYVLDLITVDFETETVNRVSRS